MYPQKSFSEDNVALVNLQADQSIFDYCDLSSYSREGVRALLEYHHINQSMIDGGLRWVGLQPTYVFCDDFDYTKLLTNYVLSWDQTLAPFHQELGCVGAVSVNLWPYAFQYATFAGVNMDTGLISSDLFILAQSEEDRLLHNKVVGKELTIFGAIIGEQDADYSGYYGPLLETIANYIERNMTFKLSHIQDDPDTVNAGYVDPSIPFYHYHRATTSLCCIITSGAILHNFKVIRSYFKSKRHGFHFSLVCLLFALLGNIARFLVFLDPWSLMGRITYIEYVIAVSVSDSCHVFSSAASLVVWVDLVIHVNAARSMRLSVVNYVKSPFVRVLFFALLTVLALVDGYCMYTTNIMADPWGNSDWAYMWFEEKDADGVAIDGTGVYVSYFGQFIRLLVLALFEFAVATYAVTHKLQEAASLSHKNNTATNPNNAVGMALVISKTGGKVSVNTFSRVSPPPPLVKEANDVKPSSPSLFSSSTPGTVVPAEILNHQGMKDVQDGGKREGLKTQVAKRVASLSKYMYASGVVMMIASIMILTEGHSTAWVYCRSNPYVMNASYLIPALLIQVSSVWEVSAVDEIIIHNIQQY